MTTARDIQALIDCTPLAQIEHPQYIEGTLYITRRQLEAIEATSPGLPTTMTSYIALGSIPVRVLDPGVPVRLPSGNVVIYLPELDSLCVVNAATAPVFTQHSTPHPEGVARVRDAIWEELERQAERFGHVDRDRSVVAMTAIELDMDRVAAAAINAVNAPPGPRAGRRDQAVGGS
ncbi:hypothetical protein [Mycobacteroides abscessus]|uniref:hypothetical protein n=1 Tax=Mycobacteroides abscessus TaxID=36809 RepID=UPI000927DA46|nr:hypothetical protein [Mycobacteroides abscessus]SIK47805.1 Uncharacterised protein [Mycobacteroides abscessus subsp. abscessus]